MLGTTLALFAGAFAAGGRAEVLASLSEPPDWTPSPDKRVERRLPGETWVGAAAGAAAFDEAAVGFALDVVEVALLVLRCTGSAGSGSCASLPLSPSLWSSLESVARDLRFFSPALAFPDADADADAALLRPLGAGIMRLQLALSPPATEFRAIWLKVLQRSTMDLTLKLL